MARIVRPGMCYLLGLLMSVHPILGQVDRSYAQTSTTCDGPQPVAKPSAEERERAAEDLERGLRAVQDAQHEIPRASFDPQAIVETVGKDAGKLFEWVRDNTYWVPYRGALRGPTGVLMDRLGNSLDRSLLLADLLRIAGHQVRLAHTQLTRQQATNLFTQMGSIPEDHAVSISPPTREKAVQLVENYAAKYMLDAAALRQDMEQDWRDYDEMAAKLAERVEDQTTRLAKALGERAGRKDDRTLKTGLELLRDHWWLQYRRGSSWVDLDTLTSTSEVGTSLGTPKQTVLPDKNDGRLRLDPKFCHEVVIRVVVEQWKDGRIGEQVVLTQTLRPSDLFHERVALRHYPMNWPKDLNLFEENGRSDRLTKAALDQDEWLPVLSVGSHHFSERSFSASGETWKKTGSPLAGGLEKGVQGLNPFKRLSGLGGARRPESFGHLTAEWIDYEIRATGLPPRIIRREVFDLLGPAARMDAKFKELQIDDARRSQRALTLLGETEMLPVVCRLSTDFVEQLVTSRMLENGKIVPELVRRDDLATNKKSQEMLLQLTPLPGELQSLTLARWDRSRVGKDIYLDRPNIFAFHKYPRRKENGELVVVHAFDIVANDVALLPSVEADSFLVQLEQGILDTNAESLLLNNSDELDKNVADLFASSSAKKVDWLTIRSIDDSNWKLVNLSDDMRARIAQDIKVGYVVVVPKSISPQEDAAAIGWWRVDPASGQTLGMGDRGWGPAATEYTLSDLIVGGIVIAAILWVLYEYGDDMQAAIQSRIDASFGRGVSNLGRSSR